MILRVNNEWRIVSEPQQWVAQRLIVVQKGKTKGQETWTAQAYFTSADSAALWLAHRRVRDLPGTYPAADALEVLGAALGDMVDEIKGALA